MNAENEKIAHLFLELIETVTTLARRPVVFGKDIFYRRELHSIALIGQSEGITSAELAKFFGITRGVTHKILVQLEKKGFIRKTKQPDNRRSLPCMSATIKNFHANSTVFWQPRSLLYAANT